MKSSITIKFKQYNTLVTCFLQCNHRVKYSEYLRMTDYDDSGNDKYLDTTIVNTYLSLTAALNLRFLQVSLHFVIATLLFLQIIPVACFPFTLCDESSYIRPIKRSILMTAMVVSCDVRGKDSLGHPLKQSLLSNSLCPILHSFPLFHTYT